MDEKCAGQTQVASENLVKSVETALKLVEILRRTGGGKVSDLEAHTDLSRGALYKHLSTLIKFNFVVKNGSTYSLGFQFLNYGGWLRSRYIGAEIIKQAVQNLAQETGEVAMFAVEEKGYAVTLFRENGNNGVFTRTRLGQRLHLHQTAGGKSILSQHSDATVHEFCKACRLPEATENTITDEDTLLKQLEHIRERGYSLNQQESTQGLVAVAVPLVPKDTVIGACSVSVPHHRMDDDQIEEIAGKLLAVVNELELNIAHSYRSLRSLDQ